MHMFNAIKRNNTLSSQMTPSFVCEMKIRRLLCMLGRLTLPLVLSLAGREEFIVKTGWEELRQVWKASLPWRYDYCLE